MAKRKPMTMTEYITMWSSELSSALAIDDKSPLADTATALLITAFIEQLLMVTLDRFFVTLTCGKCKECKKGEKCKTNDTIFSPKETLDSFSKCADITLRLGLISMPMRANLALIGKIRNRFAHNPGVINFGDAEIKACVDKLTFPKVKRPPNMPLRVMPTINDPVHGDILDFVKLTDTKQRFILATTNISLAINNSAITIERLKPIKHIVSWE